MKPFIILLFVSTFLHETYSDGEKPPRKFTTGLLPWNITELDHLRSSNFFYELNHPDQEVPEYFDAREKWPECDSIGEIKDQDECGFCWAVALTTVLNDRLCISSNGTKNLRTSAEDLLTCCPYCTDPRHHPRVCERGAYPGTPISYMAKEGIVTGGEVNSGIGCKPVSEKTLKGFAPRCKRKCTNPNYATLYDEDKVFIKGVRLAYEPKVKQIQTEILKHGPVMAPVAMTEQAIFQLMDPDFRGVYTYSERDDENHAVRIIGWGTENGVPYWLIANSYGEQFGGNGGFFKLKRGVNLLRIEEYALGLITEFDNSSVRSSGQLILIFSFIGMLLY